MKLKFADKRSKAAFGAAMLYCAKNGGHLIGTNFKIINPEPEKKEVK